MTGDLPGELFRAFSRRNRASPLALGPGRHHTERMRQSVVATEQRSRRPRAQVPLITAGILVFVSVLVAILLAGRVDIEEATQARSPVPAVDSVEDPGPISLGTSGAIAGFVLLGGWVGVGSMMFIRAGRRRDTAGDGLAEAQGQA